MKTIEDLNLKAWYRFLKLIYLTVFSVLIIGFPVGLFVSVYSHPTIKTHVKCENGKIIDPFDLLGFIPTEQNTIPKSFVSDKGLTYEELIAMGGTPVEKPETIPFGSTPLDPVNMNLPENKNEFVMDPLNNEQFQELRGIGLSTNQIIDLERICKTENGHNQIAKINTDKFEDYHIVKVKDIDWLYFFTYSFVSILSIFTIFEFLRRSLYYVVLGKINPLKK